MAITASVLVDADEPEGIVRVACAASAIATHLRPDLDALLAVWMCQRVRYHAGVSPVRVLFLPANVREVEEGVFAIDMGPGKGVRTFGRGHSLKWSLHAEGGSCSLAVWRALPEEERSIFEPLARAISDADQYGENIHRIVSKKGKVPVSETVRDQMLATNIWTMHTSLATIKTDTQMLEFWSAIFDGILICGLIEKQAEKHAAQANFLCDGILAILPHNAPTVTSRLVFEKGAKLAVFSSEIGNNQWTLGATRSAGNASLYINLAKYQDEITALVPGIYIHPSGYLVGWTATAPLFATREEFEKKRADFIRAMVSVLSNLSESRG